MADLLLKEEKLMGSVNLTVLRKEIVAQAKNSVESRVNKVLENVLTKERDRFLQKFDKHEVTRSIESGPQGNDGLVDTKKGGNLFSLIGFKAGANPISDLRAILRAQFNFRGGLRTRLSGNKIIVEKTVESPSLTGIEKETAGKYGLLDWTNKSWVRLIEDGVPWFRAYLFGKKYSKYSYRSGMAIQAKDGEGNLKTVRNESFGAIPYLSVLLREFRNRIRRISDR